MTLDEFLILPTDELNKLQTLDLSNNELGNMDATTVPKFCFAIRQCYCLLTLNLSNNNLHSSDIIIQDLCTILSTCNSVNSLILNDNGLNEEQIHKFEQNIATHAETKTIYEQAIIAMEPKSQFVLARKCGQQPLKDDVQTVFWLKQAAGLGYYAAQINLGYMYYYGLGVQKSYEQALSLYKTAAKQELFNAPYNIGRMYANGRGNILQNYTEARSWFTIAAQHGNTLAQFNLAYMYAYGIGGINDINYAVYWFELAMKRDNLGDEFNLAGSTDQLNMKLFLDLIAKAKLDPKIQFALGCIYRRDQTKDEAQSIYWLKKSAHNGNMAASRNLKAFYPEQQNSPKDNEAITLIQELSNKSALKRKRE